MQCDSMRVELFIMVRAKYSLLEALDLKGQKLGNSSKSWQAFESSVTKTCERTPCLGISLA